MGRTPDTVNIRLHDLMLLLCYRWSATQIPSIGELGEEVYEDMLAKIDAQSNLEITPAQLTDLVHHMKEVMMDKGRPFEFEFGLDNYNRIMRRLRRSAPNLFKELSTGEVIMHELEEKAFE